MSAVAAMMAMMPAPPHPTTAVVPMMQAAVSKQGTNQGDNYCNTKKSTHVRFFLVCHNYLPWRR
jgi:hypothetical protein